MEKSEGGTDHGVKKSRRRKEVGPFWEGGKNSNA